MLRLTKTSSTRWNGRHCGTSSASWSVVGFPDWFVSSRNGDWFAHNSKTGQSVNGYTRQILLEKIENLLST